MLHAVALVAALAASAEKPKIAVLELQSSGVDATSTAALYDRLVQEVARRGYFDPVSQKDIQTMLGLERQKEMLGCSEAAQSCMTELAGALGSRFVLSGTVSKLGDAVQLSLQMLDTQKAQPVARSLRIARDVQALAGALPWAVAEATGTPLPPPPSTTLPWSMIGVGAVGLAAGTVLGINAISRDLALTAELDSSGNQYRKLAYYEAESASVGTFKTAALVSSLVGAAVLAGGIFLFPEGAAAQGGGGFALVPGPGGLAVAGVFP